MRSYAIVSMLGLASLLFGGVVRAQPRGMDAGVARDAGPADGGDAAVPVLEAGVVDASTPDDAAPALASNPRDVEARALYVAGRAALEAGRFVEARAHFVRAWELSGRPSLFYDIGRACDLLRRDAEALEAFQRYLRALPDAPNRDEVRGRVEVLRRSVRAARNATTERPPVRAHRVGGPTVLETWWFWTIVGAVVVGAVAVGVTVATNGETRPAVPGDVGPGGVIEALRSP